MTSFGITLSYTKSDRSLKFYYTITSGHDISSRSIELFLGSDNIAGSEEGKSKLTEEINRDAAPK